MGILDRFIGNRTSASFKQNLRNVLGFVPGKTALYKAALTHRSVRDNADENNERLEYLGDAILSGIIADWDAIARRAEHYDLTLDDWLNDLDLRDIIAGAIVRASGASSDSLRDALQRADDAFRAATIELEESLWGANVDGEHGRHRHDRTAQWWYFRYPRRPGFSIRRDLESAGIAPVPRSRRKT